MQEVNNQGDVDVSISQTSMSMSLKRKIGEEMILEKINKIFDEVAKDRDEFEDSYQSKSPNQKQARDRKTQ